MAISLQELQNKGDVKVLSLDDLQKKGDFKVVSTPKVTLEPTSTGFDKFASTVSAPLEKLSGALFGSTSKAVGGMLTSGIGAAESLYGQLSGNKKLVERGTKLQKLGEKEITPSNIAFSAIELYPGGGYVTNVLKKIPGGNIIANAFSKLPEKLKESAIKDYSEALGATTKELKVKTAKVVPDLLKRGEVTTSLKGLEKRSTSKLKEAGSMVKEAEETIKEGSMVKVQPLLKPLDDMMSKYIVDGKIINKNAKKAIDETADTLLQFGDEISEKSLLKVRRILDDSVKVANKNFTKDDLASITANSQELLANTIRETLNSNNPILNKANKEFNLWSNVNKIVKATNERRSSQGGIISKYLIPGSISASAYGSSGDPTASILTFFGSQAIIKSLTSSAFKTSSAVTKNKLADLISSGKLKEASVMLSKIVSSSKNLSSENK